MWRRMCMSAGALSVVGLVATLSGGSSAGPNATAGGIGGTGAGMTAISEGAAAHHFSISFSPDALAYSFTQGEAGPARRITGTGMGAVPDRFYLGAFDEGHGLDANIRIEPIGGDQVEITVYPRPDLVPGQYKGMLTLVACPDRLCTRPYPGSPESVPYTVDVHVTPAQQGVPAQQFRVRSIQASTSALTGTPAT